MFGLVILPIHWSNYHNDSSSGSFGRFETPYLAILWKFQVKCMDGIVQRKEAKNFPIHCCREDWVQMYLMGYM